MKGCHHRGVLPAIEFAANPETVQQPRGCSGLPAGEARAGFPIRPDMAQRGGQVAIEQPQHAKRTLGGALLRRAEGQAESLAQRVGQHFRRQGTVPSRRMKPGAGAGEKLGGDGPRRGAYDKGIRDEHILNVVGEARPVRRQRALGDAEERCEHPEFGIVALALLGRERRVDKLESGNRAVGEGGEDPAQGGDVVGAISGPGGEDAGALGEDAADRGVPPVKPAGGGDRFLGRAEHHRKDEPESAVKPADRVRKAARMLGDSRGNPGMRQLHQQRAAGGKKNRGLAIDPPHHRAGSENPARPVRARAANHRQLAFEAGVGHNAAGLPSGRLPAGRDGWRR